MLRIAHIAYGRRFYTVALMFCLFLIATQSRSDTLVLTSGSRVECVILQETDSLILAKLKYGTIGYSKAYIQSVERDSSSQVIQPVTERLANWSTAIRTLAHQTWATDLKQIPAVVVNVGTLRNVPYQSFRCGENNCYEINIYGDPDHPAGLEMGALAGKANDPEARDRCIEFVASLLGDKDDIAIVRKLNRATDIQHRNNGSFEITPPDAPDAYGGWWVSVYLDDQIEKARATNAEMKRIALSRAAIAEAAADRKASELAEHKRVKAEQTAELANGSDWTPSDLTYARGAQSGGSQSAAGSDVYVRGYMRADGTYVHAYTRAAPGHGGGRR